MITYIVLNLLKLLKLFKSNKIHFKQYIFAVKVLRGVKQLSQGKLLAKHLEMEFAEVINQLLTAVAYSAGTGCIFFFTSAYSLSSIQMTSSLQSEKSFGS